MTDEELCGEIKADGEPCDYTAKCEDGKCGIHTESNNQGRPFSITEDDHEDILEAARLGKSERGCARSAGVEWPQLNNYLEAHPSFRSSFARARAQGEDKLISGGLRDPDVDSSFAKFMLASSFDYKKTEAHEHEHSGEGGGPLEVIIGGDK